MSHKKFSPTVLFYNDRFVLVFSVCIAAVLWIIMATTNTLERPVVIEVPINIVLSDTAQSQGLKVFEQSSKTAKVSIKGNSVIVHQIKESNLQIVAELASSINKPGNYTLPLTVQKQGTIGDYEVVSVDPSPIIVTVDYNKTVPFKIESKIKNYKIADGYFSSDPTFSPDTVTVSGPQNEVSNVAKVCAEYDVGATLNKTKEFTAKLALYDATGAKITSDKLKLSAEEVKCTITVLSRQISTLNASFTNKPSGLTLLGNQLTIDPINIEVACPEDTIDAVKTLNLAAIDFAAISPTKNTFRVNITLPPDCKSLGNVYAAGVTLNLNGFSTKSLNVKTFTMKNLAASKSAEVNTKSLSVTVVGPESEISKLTDDSLSAQIDMTGKDYFTGRTEMPIAITIDGTSSSWIFGSYKANISESEKTTG